MSHNQNHYRSHAPSRRDTARHPPRVHRFGGMTSGPGGHMMESLKKAFFRAMPKGEPGAEEWRTGLKIELKQNYGRWSVLDRATVNEVAKELRSWRREGKQIPDVPQVVAMFAWPVFRERALVDKRPAVLTAPSFLVPDESLAPDMAQPKNRPTNSPLLFTPGESSVLSRLNDAWVAKTDEAIQWRKDIRDHIKTWWPQWNERAQRRANKIISIIAYRAKHEPQYRRPLSGEVIVDLDFSPLDVSTGTLCSLVDQAGCDQEDWKAEIWDWLGHRWGTMEPLSREAMIDILAEEVLYVKRWNVLRHAEAVLAQLKASLLSTSQRSNQRKEAEDRRIEAPQGTHSMPDHAMPFHQQVPLGHPGPFARQNVPRMPSSHVPPPPSASHSTNHRFDATTQMLPDFHHHIVPKFFPTQTQYSGMNATMQNEMVPPAFATPTNHGGVNPSVQNQFMTSAYPLVQQPRQDPSNFDRSLQDWHQSARHQPQAAVPSSDTYGMLSLPPSIYGYIPHDQSFQPSFPALDHQSRLLNSLGGGPRIGHCAARRYGTTKARWEAERSW